jgi:hypothetical protein
MIRAGLMISAAVLCATMAVAQQTDNAPATDAPAAVAQPATPSTATSTPPPASSDQPAAPATEPVAKPVAPPKLRTTPATTVAKSRTAPVTNATTSQGTTPAVVTGSYIPQTPAGQPQVTDAVPGKDGIKRLLVLRGLDKITGRPTNIYAPVGVPVKFATLTVTARYCYSTPSTEPPETTAFLQISDNRPDQPERKMFSGWMLASSPSLNGLEHPLYDVWVISCMTNKPGQQAPVVASTAVVKTVSPDAGSKEAIPDLPEGSGQ